MSFLFTTCLIFSTLYLTTDAFPSGAPPAACLSLSPQHGVSTRPPATSPFAIRAFSKAENGQVVIHVSIAPKGVEPFRGFIAQARRADNPNIIIDGSFLPGEVGVSQTMACDVGGSRMNTWTHTNSAPKTRVTAIWIPPPNFTGNILFKATIVSTRATYWEGQLSAPVTLSRKAAMGAFGNEHFGIISIGNNVQDIFPNMESKLHYEIGHFVEDDAKEDEQEVEVDVMDQDEEENEDENDPDAFELPPEEVPKVVVTEETPSKEDEQPTTAKPETVVEPVEVEEVKKPEKEPEEIAKEPEAKDEDPATKAESKLPTEEQFEAADDDLHVEPKEEVDN